MHISGVAEPELNKTLIRKFLLLDIENTKSALEISKSQRYLIMLKKFIEKLLMEIFLVSKINLRIIIRRFLLKVLKV